MNERIELAKQAGHTDWVMRITADRRIEVNESVEVTETAQKVLDALQNLLKPAQPEQEPVAFLVDGDLYYPEEIDWETLQEQGHTVASLYTSPPQPALEQNFCPRCGKRTQDIHTCTPPPQEKNT